MSNEPDEPMITSRATMKDVANVAGVSLKTVSRVINHESNVNEQLVQRVEDAVQKLSYRPNLKARSLRRLDGRSSTIGVLLEDLSNPFSATIIRAIEEVATRRGVSVLAGSLDESAERERSLATSMSSHQVDGMILAPASQSHDYLARDQHAGTAFVFVDRPPIDLDADHVLSDNRDGTARAIDRLLDLGHRRIGFLGDDAVLWTARERYLGYEEAHRARGLEVASELVHFNVRSSSAASMLIDRMLELSDPPTAIFAGRNILTIGAVRSLRAHAVERRTALVGFDDFPLADLLVPAVSVVAQEVSMIGRRAAELLFNRLDGDRSATQRVVVSTRYVARGSGEIRPWR